MSLAGLPDIATASVDSVVQRLSLSSIRETGDYQQQPIRIDQFSVEIRETLCGGGIHLKVNCSYGVAQNGTYAPSTAVMTRASGVVATLNVR